MTPVWPIRGGSGGKSDRLFRLSTYAFPIPLNTFSIYKSNIKGDIRQKLEISYFTTPVWPMRGVRGKTDRLFRLSTYAFPIPLNTFWSYKSNYEGDIRQKLLSNYIMTPVWPMGGSGDKSDRLFRFSTYAFPIPLNTFWRYKSNNKGDIRQKLKISYFMTPVWPIRRGRGIKVTSYLDSPHMLSYYLTIHFMALSAILKKTSILTHAFISRRINKMY